MKYLQFIRQATKCSITTFEKSAEKRHSVKYIIMLIYAGKITSYRMWDGEHLLHQMESLLSTQVFACFIKNNRMLEE